MVSPRSQAGTVLVIGGEDFLTGSQHRGNHGRSHRHAEGTVRNVDQIRGLCAEIVGDGAASPLHQIGQLSVKQHGLVLKALLPRSLHIQQLARAGPEGPMVEKVNVVAEKEVGFSQHLREYEVGRFVAQCAQAASRPDWHRFPPERLHDRTEVEPERLGHDAGAVVG